MTAPTRMAKYPVNQGTYGRSELRTFWITLATEPVKIKTLFNILFNEYLQIWKVDYYDHKKRNFTVDIYMAICITKYTINKILNE